MPMLDTETVAGVSRKSHAWENYDLCIENDLFQCRIYWIKVIGSETESLFTQYTKHTFYEIQYALEGRIVMQIERNQDIRIEQSNFIVIPPDTFHQIIDGDSVGARFIMAFSLEIKDNCLSGLQHDLSEPIPYRETPQMRKLLTLMLGKQDYDTPLRRKQLVGYLECFLLEMMEAISPFVYRTLPQNALNDKELRVAQIQKFIADCNGVGIRPSDIAQRFNICERHLNRIFVEITGATLKENINRKKLAKVEELVATTNLSFREISQLCDFSDAYTMNKFFKKYNYNSLREYRALSHVKKEP